MLNFYVGLCCLMQILWSTLLKYLNDFLCISIGSCVGYFRKFAWCIIAVGIMLSGLSFNCRLEIQCGAPTNFTCNTKQRFVIWDRTDIE